MMARIFLVTGLIFTFFLSTQVSAASYSVEQVKQAPPEELSAAIREQLSETSYKVTRGSSRTVAEIWLTKEWEVPKLEPAGDLIYPFLSGQLIGAIRYPRDASDFRDQEIDDGVYTLRYGQQPVDGAHIGTSPTRDFLLLLDASKDKSTEPPDYRTLTEVSSEAAGTTHPALLSLQRTKGEEPVREDTDHDWWLVRLTGTAKAEDETKQLPMDLVIEGQAIE